MKKLILISLAIVGSFSVIAQDSVTYDFNTLQVGNLNNQDNWKTVQQVNGTADFQVDIAGGTVVSPDGSNAVFYTAGGPGVGRTATRKATTNFNFDFQIGGVQEFEFDLYRNYWGFYIGIGFDADHDGIIAPGLGHEPNDGGLMMNVAAKDSLLNNKIILPNGTSVVFTAITSGWCRYKWVIDFTAYGGEGALGLFYKPAGITTWIAIPQIQGINMHLTPGSGTKTDNQVWDGIFFHSEGATGGLDNLKIHLPNTGGLLTQFIDFPVISNKLTTDAPFALNATASSGLPVSFTVLSGPATLAGNLLTLTGQAGMVSIKASQAGDTVFAPAADIINTFEVVDASAYQASLVIRRPADDTKAYMNELSPILLVASATVEHPEVLSVQSVNFLINGQTIPGKNWGNGYFTGQWTPPSFGNYILDVSATITGGNIHTSAASFEVTSAITPQTVITYDSVWFKPGNTVVTADFVFPTHVGAFNQIMAFLSTSCPTGGCETYDRISDLEVRGPNGKWIELFRYITPFGKGCSHQQEVTDYESLLQGKVEMRFTWGLYENGYIADLNFQLTPGQLAFKYTWVDALWQGIYPFGDYADLQPVPEAVYAFSTAATAAKLKIISTGHGWGSLNTGNAAEFYDATHFIKINNSIAFTQHLWINCSTNPDGCQPQYGTWYHPRAGWCPGSISEIYDYDLSSYISQSSIHLKYWFDSTYMDYCHPNNPNCTTGVTCSNCNDPDNPRLHVAANIITYSNNPFIGIPSVPLPRFSLTPNPATDWVRISSSEQPLCKGSVVDIYNSSGRKVDCFSWNGDSRNIDISHYHPGLYIFRLVNDKNSVSLKLIIQ